jgi:hypothetical protein
MVSVIKGTGDSSLLAALPRFLLVPLMTFAIRAEAKEAKNDDVPLQVLIPTMHSDSQLVKDMEGSLEHFQGLQAKVLLLGGSKSAAYLKDALASLSMVLPHAQRIELAGLGHSAADNGGKPELVAQVLRRFFDETATHGHVGGRR